MTQSRINLVEDKKNWKNKGSPGKCKEELNSERLEIEKSYKVNS